MCRHTHRLTVRLCPAPLVQELEDIVDVLEDQTSSLSNERQLALMEAADTKVGRTLPPYDFARRPTS